MKITIPPKAKKLKQMFENVNAYLYGERIVMIDEVKEGDKEIHLSVSDKNGAVIPNVAVKIAKEFVENSSIMTVQKGINCTFVHIKE